MDSISKCSFNRINRLKFGSNKWSDGFSPAKDSKLHIHTLHIHVNAFFPNFVASLEQFSSPMELQIAFLFILRR